MFFLSFKNGTSVNTWMLQAQISGIATGQWGQAQFPIITMDNYQVVLQFTRQLGIAGKGFVAVDDVKFNPGNCRSKLRKKLQA